MSDPLTWVLGYAGKKSLDWLVGAAGKEDLHKRLRKAVSDWSSTLPAEISVFPNALFPDTIDAAMASDPAIVEIGARLSENRLPAVEQWAAMIGARHRFVKGSAAPSKLQPFFAATEDQVRGAILQLAESIDRECRQDTRLCKGETLGKLDELARSLDELKQKGSQRPLQWTEEHVLVTLGLGRDSSSAERDEAKRSKLHHFNESLLDVLSGRDSFAQLLVKHSQALAIPADSALDSWMRDSLQLPSDLSEARASVAVVGWQFETTDSRVSFSSTSVSKIIPESQYTANLVSFFHSIFPNVAVTIACLDTSIGAPSQFHEFDAFKALESVIEKDAARIVVIPFQLEGDKNASRSQVYANIAQLGFISVVPLSFAHGTTVQSGQERIAVLASPVNALRARQEKDEVVCFPVAQVVREGDGTGKIVSNDALGCLVAAGMASLLMANAPKRTSSEVIKAIHDSRPDPAYPIPSFVKASKLLG
jgi:hypothetical protein